MQRDQVLARPALQAHPRVERAVAAPGGQASVAAHLVYVQALDNPADRTQVSAAGGFAPAWSPDGKSLFYRQGNLMMVAAIRMTGGVSADIPERLFDGGWTLPGDFSFAVMPDGEHFLMVQQTLDAVPTRIDVVLNWAATLEDKMRQ